MKYEKPNIQVTGNAVTRILGTKGINQESDSMAPFFVQSLGAYEADE